MLILLEESKVSCLEYVRGYFREGLGYILLEVIRILYSSKPKLPSYWAWLVISS